MSLFWSSSAIYSAVGVKSLSAFPLLPLIFKASVIVAENCIVLDRSLKVISFSVMATAFFYSRM